MSAFGEKCLYLGLSDPAAVRELAAREPVRPESGLGLNADQVYTLGEYRCGCLEHPYSRVLMEFKDNRGRFGRGSLGRRRHVDFFAQCLAAVVLDAPGLAGYSVVAIVPPKLNQRPEDYHLYDLALVVGEILAADNNAGHPVLRKDLLSFRNEIPPLKSLDLSCRDEVITRGVECVRPLDGQSVVLLDDIIASGATARECVRALREAGASAVAVLALARRVG